MLGVKNTSKKAINRAKRKHLISEIARFELTKPNSKEHEAKLKIHIKMLKKQLKEL